MSRRIHRFDPPERFVAGTVGEPGQRAFYLQARTGSRLCSVLLEKQQVAVLAERLDALLDQIILRTGGRTEVPAVAPAAAEDLAPLEVPLEEEFRVGTMTLGWDEQAQRIVIEAFAVPEAAAEESDTEAGAESEAEPSEQPDEPSDEASERGWDERARAAAGAADPQRAAAPAEALSEDEPGDLLEVHLDGASARAFVARARALVAAGRATCPLCGQPLDPSGHVCPRQNGYRRR